MVTERPIKHVRWRDKHTSNSFKDGDLKLFFYTPFLCLAQRTSQVSGAASISVAQCSFKVKLQRYNFQSVNLLCLTY